ncbi:MAG: PQQ-binding-like beta-propeller repeat protein [Myxococcales bacterium]|nr:PQQ-binding-like beta-propeller repeat protein [Myxococcales bacterium]MCB9531100.1 PQQ-binding-like beta-propeller repeat protein [Myxococcales bacterium]MCB9533010.1 PQQ-binding-like beta-propeller repeat protein [Myxococcales bacterium]
MRRLAAAVLVALGGSACAGAQLPADLRAIAASSADFRMVWAQTLDEGQPLTATKPQRGGVAVAGDVVVVTLASGAIVGVDAADGHRRWEQTTSDDPIAAPPTAHGRTAYAVDGRGVLLAIDATSGAIVWSTPLEDEFRSAPVVADGLILCASATGALYAVDSTNGRLAWQFTRRRVGGGLSIAGAARPAAVEDFIYYGTPEGTLVALDRSGEDVWIGNLALGEDELTDVDSTPVVVDGVVIASSFSGGVSGLDARSGIVRWHAEHDGGVSAIDVGDAVAVPTLDGVLWLDPTTGEELGVLGLDSAAPGEATRAGDKLVVATPDNGLYLVEASRPWLHARFDPGPGFEHGPAVAGDAVFALSREGTVYRLDIVGR